MRCSSKRGSVAPCNGAISGGPLLLIRNRRTGKARKSQCQNIGTVTKYLTNHHFREVDDDPTDFFFLKYGC